MKYFLLSVIALFSINGSANAKTLKIYAAASLTNALQEIGQHYQKKNLIFNFDATSKLAKQIEHGAPADLFFSADLEWMNYLQDKDRILESSRVDLLSNKIVLIIPIDSKKIPATPNDLKDDFYHHIALAGETVPAGKFARAALESEKVLTKELKKKIVNADNVRVALSWVALHEAAAGIVYQTDVLIEPKVKVAFSFREGTYPKIIYPAAVVKSSAHQSSAQNFLEFCKSPEGLAIFKKHGFSTL